MEKFLIKNSERINIKNIFLYLFILLNIGCIYKEYYNIKPYNFDYNDIFHYNNSEDFFDEINNNAFIFFLVWSGGIDLDMMIKNASLYKNIYIKEISCKINDDLIFFIKDKYFEIDYNHILLGKIENKDLRKLIKIIGKEEIYIPITQKYILDNGSLIEEEYIYKFEYKNRIAFWGEK